MKLYNEPSEEEIRAKACEIYERSGRVEGRDIDNWVEAEQIVYAGRAEKVGEGAENEVFNNMPFEGSE